MSTSFQPRSRWASGTNQNSIPANDNTLRTELMERPWLGVENSPPTSNDFDVYVVGDTPADEFATFDENDVAIYLSGTWKAWAPFTGMRGVVAGVRKVFDGAAWIDDPSVGGGGGGGAVDSVNGQTGDVVLELNDLDDVSAAAPDVDDVLTWNGSAWVPEPTSGGGGGSDWVAPVGFYGAPIAASSPVFYLGDSAPGQTALIDSFSATANRLYYVPFTVPYDITLATLGVNLKATSVGNKARVGIYSNVVTSGKCAPGSLLYSTGDLSLNTATVVTSASTQVLEAGKLYWAAHCQSGTAASVGVSGSAGIMNLGRIGTSNYNAYSHVYETLSGGWTDLPATAGSLTAGSGAVPAPIVTFA